jgi:hypothetical protein
VLVHERPAGSSYSSLAALERGQTVQISADAAVVPMAVDRFLP